MKQIRSNQADVRIDDLSRILMRTSKHMTILSLCSIFIVFHDLISENIFMSINSLGYTDTDDQFTVGITECQFVALLS